MSGTILRIAAVLALAGSLLSASAQVEEGYVVTSDGVRLYYQKLGDSGPVLIVPARLYVFEDFKLLARGRTLISYDMRNRGRSDRVEAAARITIQDDIRDLEAVRRHFGAQKFSTIGYSYLGLMVVMYAMEHPERVERIVQMGPVPRKFGTEYPPELVAGDGMAVLDQEALAQVRKLRQEGFHEKNPREYCELEWQLTRVRLVGDPAHAAKLSSPCEMPNEWPVNLARHLDAHFLNSVQKLDLPAEAVQQVRVPVLTVHGTRDRNAPYAAGREWAMTLPNARLVTVEGGAHQVWLDAPEALDAIDSFLRGQWPERAEHVTELLPQKK